MNDSSTDGKAYPTTAQRVTFFEDRAEVVRTGKVSVADGRQWVRLGGTTPLLDDRSVQAKCASDRVKVLSARVRRSRRLVNELSPDEELAIRKVVQQLTQKVVALQNRHERLARQTDYVGELLDNWAEVLGGVPMPGQDSSPEEWRQAWQTLVERDDRLLGDILEVMNEQDDLQRNIDDENDRLRASHVTRMLFDCEIEVQLDVSTTDDVELEVSYRTPCALWRPEHMARLDADQAEIEWTTWGVIWQRTGEVWDDVQVRFSTARPASVADAPEIRDDVLTKRRKTAEEKKKVHVQVREETIAEAGQREEPQMPGVDDGGKPVEFAPEGSCSLRSDGQPTRVEIARRTLEAEVKRVLLPERSQVTYIKADAGWQGNTPLLAGPLRVARGAAMVGQSRARFAAPGETFETGFGIEDAVRCKRSVQERRDKAKLSGTETIERTVKLHLSALGRGGVPVQIIERVPVSEIEGLEVKLEKSEGWEKDKDGYLRQTVTPGPGQQLELSYRYEIKAKSNVVLPF